MKIFDINQDKLNYEFNYNPEETAKLKKLFLERKENKPLSIDDFRRVALWKYNRVLEISDELLQKLSELGKTVKIDIYDKKVRDIIGELIACKGIGLPLASSILKFLRPDIFPIIDVRAYRAIFGKKIYSTQYTVSIYYKYVKEIYEIKNKLKLPLDKVDEQLYEFDIANNGKI
ncbi:hypothetical protein CMO93_02175 [Candidatus Woesearchaeota archaeon]|nr:hypothetical protein [Candidatus Woesearchaeota archaeon]|tara:strand:- start:930 stop:1451 length:522 start_codon:yes stop_codon:yes gene_type:complete